MAIDAYYIDGQTSRRRACVINFQLNSLSIRYLNEEAVEVNSFWDVKGILKQEIRTSSMSLKYGDFPHAVLELNSQQDLNTIIEQYPHALFHQSAYNRFAQLGWKGIASTIVGVILVTLFFFIYGVPFIADGFARSIPKEYETYIGENFRQTYLQYQEVDSLKSHQIQHFYDHLNLESDYDISVVVVRSDIMNAFALPGGFIVVFSGLLELMEEEGELAGLLAHEASHINERHSLRLISKDLAMYLLFSSLTGDVGGFSSILIENSNRVSSLSFSRNFEKEADLEGLNLLVKAEINPEGMLQLFAKFQSLNDSMENIIRKKLSLDSLDLKISADTASSWYGKIIDKVPELLLTHPIPENRMKYLQEEIVKLDKSLTYLANDSLEYYFNKLLGKGEVNSD
jgi:Zn-dependent protease with chaperone function